MQNASLDRLPRLLVAAMALAAAAGAPAFAPAATFVVNIGAGGSHAFVDQTSGTNTTTIQVGDTVQWNWLSGPHSTSSGTCTAGGGIYGGGCTMDNQWDSGPQSSGSFTHTFSTAGNFNYFCSIHQAMMQGLVKVQAVSVTPPAAAFRFSPTGPVTGTAVRFTDASTGTPTSWSWNFGDGNVANVQNPSHSYAAAGTYTVTLSSTNAGGTNTASQSVTVAPGGATACVADASTLCLSNGRFQVTAQWQKTDGSSGSGNAISLTADSGYFWFFDPTNIELITKVLNACAVNTNYWVFGAGLTNVKVTVNVLDTSNGVSEQYVNPLNVAFQPIQDTAAFPTCP